MVDPFNFEAIVEAIIKIKNDTSLRTAMVEKGFIQAAKFSWKAMAQQVYGIYKALEKKV